MTNKQHVTHEKIRTWLRKGNLKRETESLQITAQNNAIRTNIKARIDKTQQNSKSRLCGDRDEAINHVINECSKLAQEYKTMHDWVGKVIHGEMCKFDHTSKWYMHNPASVLGNDTHKLLWDFDIQTDHLISARRLIPIVIGAFGTVTRGLLNGVGDLEIGGRVETIQTTTLLRTARILRRVQETWGDLLPLKLKWKAIS